MNRCGYKIRIGYNSTALNIVSYFSLRRPGQPIRGSLISISYQGNGEKRCILLWESTCRLPVDNLATQGLKRDRCGFEI
jgi:hypothetical protein